MVFSNDFLKVIYIDGNCVESMLNDLHIFEFSKFIPFLNMQSTLLIDNLEGIEENHTGREFVQILFRGPRNLGHWIIIWYDPQNNVLRIFDSLHETLQDDHKKYISRLFPKNVELNIIYESVQRQCKAFECGLYAIAFATSIAYGICPCNLIFDEKQMRNHLVNIFLSRQLKMFPILQNKSNNCIRQTMVYSKRENIIYDHFGDQTERFINLQNFINHYEKTVSGSNKNIIKETIDLVCDDLQLQMSNDLCTSKEKIYETYETERMSNKIAIQKTENNFKRKGEKMLEQKIDSYSDNTENVIKKRKKGKDEKMKKIKNDENNIQEKDKKMKKTKNDEKNMKEKDEKMLEPKKDFHKDNSENIIKKRKKNKNEKLNNKKEMKKNEKNKEYYDKINEKHKRYYEKNKVEKQNYYKKNKERIKKSYKKNKENIKKYYEKNKEHIKKQYETNKEKIKEYYEKNKEKVKETSKDYYKNNKEKITIRNKEKLQKEEKKIRNITYYNENKETILNKRKSSKNQVKVIHSDIDETLIAENYIGKLNLICEFCTAKHFAFELPADKKFSNCCHKGKIELIDDIKYPEEIKKLATGKCIESIDFRKNIRSYNNSLAFASFGASLYKFSGRGPSIIKICGQIYHNTYSLHPNDDETNKKYGQLYILDSEEANEFRVKNNNKCSIEILQKLDNILRKVNPYANAYKMMHEIEKEENDRCIKNGIIPKNIQMSFKRNTEKKDHRYNMPMSNEVAIVFVGENGEPPFDRDFCIYSKAGKPVRIPIISQHLDPMAYTLMYPGGGFGWMPNMKSKNKTNNISMLQFYSYKFSIRDEFNPFLNLGKLTQQYIIDAWVKVESSRLYYLKKNQSILRTELYTGLMDYLYKKKQNENVKIGKMVILPSTFTGSPRALQQNFIDAMILVQTYGKPDLFITMTCNPNWKEITENLDEYEEVINRPDIVTRVFHQKLKELKEEILKREIFGKCIAYTYVIEFQKRGLPHVHMLIFLDKEYKLFNTDKVDDIIKAEIPDMLQYPHLYETVKKFMIHGPCGIQNKNSPCMDIEKQKCTKNFPKSFNENTIFTCGYPLYRRRKDNKIIKFPGNKWADNTYVIPYNPYLLLKFNSHINVEVCSTVLCVKYLFKYCYKGHDCALIEFKSVETSDINKECGEPINEPIINNYDEIKQYENTRYLCAQEAMYRLHEFEIHEMSHIVYRLAVHNENEQNVYFKEGHEEEIFTKNVDTTLTAWFKLNQEDSNANQYLYTDIPYHYVFDKKTKKWCVRKRLIKPILVRMYIVNAQERERFFIRLLLLSVRGAKSFEDLRTYNNIVHLSFYEAAKARNLINTDDEWDKCLQESSTYIFPKTMCELFAYICVFHNPINARQLYEKYKINFYYPSMNENEGEKYAMNIINSILTLHGYSLNDFDLPCNNYLDDKIMDVGYMTQTINDSDNIHEKIKSLTTAQQVIFNKIVSTIKNENHDKYIFIDGPGGTGKSYLLNLLIDYFNKDNVNVLAVVWTGIAANLLKNGKTVHTTFKLPLNITDVSTCNVKPNTPYGKIIKYMNILFWDEISLASKFAFEAVDRLFKDLCNNEEPFGGKIVVISGDFRQTLPIVKCGNRTQIIENCVKKSYLWRHFQCLSLTENKRVSENDIEFKSWLLRVGDGIFSTEIEIENEIIKIPKENLSNGSIIEEVFGNTINSNNSDFYESVILAPTNADVIDINNKILNKMGGKSREYLSIDSAEDSKNEKLDSILPTEFLNSLTPNGLPPHKLNLKIGTCIILLRNLNLNNGLCNGTRLIVEDMKDFSILAKIITGKQSGSRVIIPRINLSPSIEEIPFHMIRRQFPVRLAHAITINKSQGQSFKKVGVYLPSPVFSHGQLYVAFSRVMSKRNLKILIPTNNCNVKKNKKRSTENNEEVYTKNIVFKEIL